MGKHCEPKVFSPCSLEAAKYTKYNLRVCALLQHFTSLPISTKPASDPSLSPPSPKFYSDHADLSTRVLELTCRIFFRPGAAYGAGSEGGREAIKAHHSDDAGRQGGGGAAMQPARPARGGDRVGGFLPGRAEQGRVGHSGAGVEMASLL